MIITKDAGASRARDVSHSRPHVVREKAAIDPIERYVASAELVALRHQAARALSQRTGITHLERGDAFVHFGAFHLRGDLNLVARYAEIGRHDG